MYFVDKYPGVVPTLMMSIGGVMGMNRYCSLWVD